MLAVFFCVIRELLLLGDIATNTKLRTGAMQPGMQLVHSQDISPKIELSPYYNGLLLKEIIRSLWEPKSK